MRSPFGGPSSRRSLRSNSRHQALLPEGEPFFAAPKCQACSKYMNKWAPMGAGLEPEVPGGS